MLTAACDATRARIATCPTAPRRAGRRVSGRPSAAVVSSRRVVQELRALAPSRGSTAPWRSTWRSTATRSRPPRCACPAARPAQPRVEMRALRPARPRKFLTKSGDRRPRLSGQFRRAGRQGHSLAGARSAGAASSGRWSIERARGKRATWASAWPRRGTSRRGCGAPRRSRFRKARCARCRPSIGSPVTCWPGCRGCGSNTTARWPTIAVAITCAAGASRARPGRRRRLARSAVLDLGSRQSAPPAAVRPAAGRRDRAVRPAGDRTALSLSPEGEAEPAAEQLAELAGARHAACARGP